jgi:hypothetical protein
MSMNALMERELTPRGNALDRRGRRRLSSTQCEARRLRVSATSEFH